MSNRGAGGKAMSAIAARLPALILIASGSELSLIPADILLREYGFTVDNVVSRARKLLVGTGESA